MQNLAIGNKIYIQVRRREKEEAKRNYHAWWEPAPIQSWFVKTWQNPETIRRALRRFGFNYTIYQEHQAELEAERQREEQRLSRAMNWTPVTYDHTDVFHGWTILPVYERTYEKKGRDRFEFLSEDLSENEMI